MKSASSRYCSRAEAWISMLGESTPSMATCTSKYSPSLRRRMISIFSCTPVVTGRAYSTRDVHIHSDAAGMRRGSVSGDDVFDPVPSPAVADMWDSHILEQATTAPPADRALGPRHAAGVLSRSQPVVAPLHAEEGGCVGHGGEDGVAHAILVTRMPKSSLAV